MLTFLLRELDEILWVWPILENHSWEKCTLQQKMLEFWCDDVMLNSLGVHKNWNFVSLRRRWSMNLCSRGERDEWKRKRKMVCSCLSSGLVDRCCWYGWKRAVSLLSFLLSSLLDQSEPSCTSFSLASTLLWFNLGYLPLVCNLISNFNNPNNYNESYRSWEKQSKTSLFKLYLRWPSVP